MHDFQQPSSQLFIATHQSGSHQQLTEVHTRLKKCLVKGALLLPISNKRQICKATRLELKFSENKRLDALISNVDKINEK